MEKPSQTNGSLLKQWANAIGVVGIPGAIAIFLVYIGATEIPKLSRGIEQVIAEVRQTRVMIEHEIEQNRKFIQIMKQTCRSAAMLAKTDEAREMARERCDE